MLDLNGTIVAAAISDDREHLAERYCPVGWEFHLSRQLGEQLLLSEYCYLIKPVISHFLDSGTHLR